MKNIKAAALSLLLLASSVSFAAGPHDGTWTGAFGDRDTGNCQGAGEKPTLAVEVENGKVLKGLNFKTRGGDLPLSGTFAADGTFRAEGSERGKGKVLVEGKTSGNTLQGRWNFEITAGTNVIKCGGPVELKKS